MSYKSPIDIKIEEAAQRIEQGMNDAIMQAVNLKIKVDKDELFRALQYDRGQYAQGYVDGLEDGKEAMTICGKWIYDDEGYHCSECFFHAYGNTAECYDGTFKFCPACGAKMEVEE